MQENNPPDLWPHQEEAVERALANPCFYLALPMGTGKSRCVVETLKRKFNSARQIQRTLIVTPPVLVPQWVTEWYKYSKIQHTKVIPLLGSGKDRLKLFKESIAQDAERVFICNFESLLMDPLFAEFIKWNPSNLIVDELHRAKNHSSKRSKRLVELSRLTTFRMGLSGTPLLNSPLDLFCQYKILDGGKTLGANFFSFRGRFMRDKNAHMPRHIHFPKWEIRANALEELNQLIAPITMTVDKKEVLKNLPPLVKTVIKVGMTPAQEKLYNDLKKDFVAYMNDRAVVAQLAIVKGLRLLQISSGVCKFEDGHEEAITDSPKMLALKYLLEEITPNAKVIVWTVWSQSYVEIKKVCKDLNIEYTELTGEISAKQKELALDDFRTNPNVRVFISNPASGGVGLNIWEAQYSIFYSRTFSLEHSEQAESRNYRSGSEIHPNIQRIDLITSGTIDEVVMERLAEKKKIGSKVLADIAREL